MKKTLTAIFLLILSSTVFANIKELANNKPVTCDNLTVTAVFSDYSYFASNDGWGIAAKCTTTPTVGTVVNINSGTITTMTSGERYINGAVLTTNGTNMVKLHKYISIADIGGGNYKYDSSTGAGQIGITNGTGLNNIGMPVVTCGFVTESANTYFTITDGISCIRIISTAKYAIGTYVIATGVVTIYKTSNIIYPAVRASDLTTIEPTILTGQVIRNGTTNGVANVIINMGTYSATTDSDGYFSINIGFSSAALLTYANDYKFSIDVSAAGEFYSNAYGVYYNNKIYSSRGLKLPNNVINGTSSELGTIRIIYNDPSQPPQPPI